MADPVNGVKVPFVPIIRDDKPYPGKFKQPKGDSFGEVFRTELEKVKFSSHAEKRLQTRNIEITETEMKKLNQAVEKAEAKGVQDSLVVMNEKAFIVNIPNRTVVTAMGVSEEPEKIYTNIDSAILL